MSMLARENARTSMLILFSMIEREADLVERRKHNVYSTRTVNGAPVNLLFVEQPVSTQEESVCQMKLPWNWIISSRPFKTRTRYMPISEKMIRYTGIRCSTASCSPDTMM